MTEEKDKKNELTRKEQKQATREKLIKTTIELIVSGGLSRVTLPKVAEKAGLSRGICNYHFHTKEQLLMDTFMSVYKEHEQAWKNALYEETLGAVERLKQFIRVLLIPPVANFDKIAVWMAFWGEAASRQIYLDFYTARDQAFENAVASVLKEIEPDPSLKHTLEPNVIAVVLTGMIDGFWLQFLIAPGRLSSEQAIAACLAYLSRFYPEFAE